MHRHLRLSHSECVCMQVSVCLVCMGVYLCACMCVCVCVRVFAGSSHKACNERSTKIDYSSFVQNRAGPNRATGATGNRTKWRLPWYWAYARGHEPRGEGSGWTVAVVRAQPALSPSPVRVGELQPLVLPSLRLPFVCKDNGGTFALLTRHRYDLAWGCWSVMMIQCSLVITWVTCSIKTNRVIFGAANY